MEVTLFVRIEVERCPGAWWGPTSLDIPDDDGQPVADKMWSLGLKSPCGIACNLLANNIGRSWFTTKGWRKFGKPLLEWLEESYPKDSFRIRKGSFLPAWEDEFQAVEKVV